MEQNEKELEFATNYDSFGVGVKAKQVNQQMGSLDGLIANRISKLTNPVEFTVGSGNADVKMRSVNIGGQIITLGKDQDIQRAIDDVHATGGGEVHLFPGTYKIPRGLSLKTGVFLVGAGREQTILDCVNANFVGANITATAVNNFSLEDLKIINGGPNNAVEVNTSNSFLISNIKIDTVNSSGIRIATSNDFQVNHSVFTNCINGAEIGSSTNFSFFNCISEYNQFDGYLLITTASVPGSFINCIGSNNGANGFKFDALGSDSIQPIKFVGCIANSNTNYGFFVNGAPSAFFGCNCEGNGVRGYDININTVIVSDMQSSGRIVRDKNDFDVALFIASDSRVTTQFDTGTTTLQNIPELHANLRNTRSYMLDATLFVTADVVGGSKFAVGGSPTLAVSDLKAEIVLLDNATKTNTIAYMQTALGVGTAQSGTLNGVCYIKGLMTIADPGVGTVTIQYAQNTASGTSSILVGSYLKVQQIA